MDFLKNPMGAERDLRNIARNFTIKRLYLETLMQGALTLQEEGIDADAIDVFLNEQDILTEIERILVAEKRVPGPDIQIFHWLTDWGYTHIDSPLYRDLGGDRSPAILKDHQGHPIPFGNKANAVYLDPLHPRVVSSLKDATTALARKGVSAIAFDHHFSMLEQRSDSHSLVDAIARLHQDEWRSERINMDPSLTPEQWLGDRLAQQFQTLRQDLQTWGTTLIPSIPKLRDLERTVQSHLAKRPPIRPDSEMNRLKQTYDFTLERFRFLEWCIATQGQNSSSPILSFLPSFGLFSGDLSSSSETRPSETLRDTTLDLEAVQEQLGELRTVLEAENARRRTHNEWLMTPETQEILTLQAQLADVQNMLVTQDPLDFITELFLGESERAEVPRVESVLEAGDVAEQLVASISSQIELG